MEQETNHLWLRPIQRQTYIYTFLFFYFSIPYFRLRAEEEQRRQQEARERQERAALQAEEERVRREEERRSKEEEERRQKEQRWKDMQDQLDREVSLQLMFQNIYIVIHFQSRSSRARLTLVDN